MLDSQTTVKSRLKETHETALDCHFSLLKKQSNEQPVLSTLDVVTAFETVVSL